MRAGLGGKGNEEDQGQVQEEGPQRAAPRQWGLRDAQ